MKYAIIALLLAFSVNEANAVVYCAAGVVSAGCVVDDRLGPLSLWRPGLPWSRRGLPWSRRDAAS